MKVWGRKKQKLISRWRVYIAWLISVDTELLESYYSSLYAHMAVCQVG